MLERCARTCRALAAAAVASVGVLAIGVGGSGAAAVAQPPPGGAHLLQRVLVPSATSHPVVAAVSTRTLNQGETTTGSISGSGFAAGATVSFGPGIKATVLSQSGVELKVRIVVAATTAVGTRSVSVTDPGGAVSTLKHACHVDYVAVFERWAVGDGAVQWTTTLVRPLFVAPPSFSFSGAGVDVTSESLNSSHQAVLTFDVSPSAAPTWRDMTISAGSSTWDVHDGLKVRPAPSISSVTPLGQGAASQTVVVKGTNFEVCATREPTITVSGSGVAVDSVSSALGNLLYLKLTVSSSAPLGARDVTMTNCDSGGTATSVGVFSVSGPPQVTSMPAIAVGVARQESVTGFGFTPLTGLSISGTGVTVSHVAYVSPTRLLASVAASPGAALGARDVTAANLGGTMTVAVGALEVDGQPTLTSVAPAAMVAPGLQAETILGTGLRPGVRIVIGTGGKPMGQLVVGQVVVVSATEVQFKVLAGAGLHPGTYDVTVINLDGGASSDPGAFSTEVQLARPKVSAVTSSPTTAGAIRVAYSGSSNAPGGQVYLAEACTNSSMTTGCVTRSAFASGSTITGLAPGTEFFVTVTAKGTPGYLTATSAVAGPARATVQLARPGVPVLGFGTRAGSISARFIPSTNAPKSTTYSAKVCANAAMTAHCVLIARVVPGSQLSGLAYRAGSPGARFFVVLRANGSAGFLASANSAESGHADTSALRAPIISAASSPSPGKIRVVISRGSGRSPVSYTVLACTDASMTRHCVRAAKFTNGAAISGLARGARYYLAVTGIGPVGFASTTSRVRGPVIVR